MTSVLSTRFLSAALLALVALPAGAQQTYTITPLLDGAGFGGRPIPLSHRVDSNGDGLPELLIASTYQVSLIQADASPRGHREIQRLRQRNGQAFVSAAVVGPPEARKLAVGWSSSLELLDLPGLALRQSTEVFWPEGIAYGDVDGDGAAEIVVGSAGGLQLLDPWTLADRGSLLIDVGKMTVADFHGDARAEVIADNGKAYTLNRAGDTLSATLVWSTTPGAFDQAIPQAFDVDGDGHVELITRHNYGATLHRFSPSAMTVPLATLEVIVGSDIADVNGDGKADFIASDGSRDIAATDLASGALLWRRDFLYDSDTPSSPSSVVAVDLDDDGTVELVWRDGSQGALYAASVKSKPPGSLLWRGHQTWGDAVGAALVRHADGTRSFAVLQGSSREVPYVSPISFRDVATLSDRGGTDNRWLPGLDWSTTRAIQFGITAVASDHGSDRLVACGAEYPSNGSSGYTPKLWLFDDRASYRTTLPLISTLNPSRVVGEPVLVGAPPHVVVAGWLGDHTLGNGAVQVIDLATGGVLWQSAPMTSSNGGGVYELVVGDFDGDGAKEVAVGFGSSVSVYTPLLGSNPRVTYPATRFSVLPPTPTASSKIATAVYGASSTVSVYDTFATAPEKIYTLDHPVNSILAFRQPGTGETLLLTDRYGSGRIIRYSDDRFFLTPDSITSHAWVLDRDGDNRLDIVVDESVFRVLRLENDYIFRYGHE